MASRHAPISLRQSQVSHGLALGNICRALEAAVACSVVYEADAYLVTKCS